MEFFNKRLKGVTVHMIPKGNNVSRYKQNGGAFNQTVTAVITSVSPKFVKMLIDGSTYEERLSRRDDFPNELGDHTGYKVFLTTKDVGDHIVATRMRQKLRYESDSITDSQALAIAEIFKWI
jgi:hypothetical protein